MRLDDHSRRVARDRSALLDAFREAPKVDGLFLFDRASREAVAEDAGGIVSMTPGAVLRPQSVDDVVRTVRFCHEHGIRVVARGQGHTTFGQAQTEGGLVVDFSSLATIHTIEDDRARVDAGVTWRRLLTETTARSRMPPVLTAFQGSSIGGTLSMGGIGAIAYDKGAQVDHVLELEVVTGDGRLRVCSDERDRGLFNAVLAGGGRCAFIVRATLRLVSAPERVLHSVHHYRDLGPFLRDLRLLAAHGSYDGVSGTIFLDSAGVRYELNASSFFRPPGRPAAVELPHPVATVPHEDHDFLDYCLQVDRLIERLSAAGQWKGVAHPWLDVFLPDGALESFLDRTLTSLNPLDDVGPPELGSLGQMHLFPLWSRHLRRPLLRVPHGELVFLFDILSAARTAVPNRAFADRMLQRNRRLFEHARSLGGTRYNISAIPFSHVDWVRQLGPAYPAWALQKRACDPAEIMGQDAAIC